MTTGGEAQSAPVRGASVEDDTMKVLLGRSIDYCLFHGGALVEQMSMQLDARSETERPSSQMRCTD